MTVINRNTLKIVHQNVGFNDYDLIEPGELRELMFSTISVKNDVNNPVYLSRLAL